MRINLDVQFKLFLLVSSVLSENISSTCLYTLVNESYVDHTVVAQEVMPWPGIGWQSLDNGGCLERVDVSYAAFTGRILRFLATLLLWCCRFTSLLVEQALRSLSVADGSGRATCKPFGGTFSICPAPFFVLSHVTCQSLAAHSLVCFQFLFCFLLLLSLRQEQGLVSSILEYPWYLQFRPYHHSRVKEQNGTSVSI